MGIRKDKLRSVQEFSFGELIPSGDSSPKNLDSFDFKSLSFAQDLKHDLTEESIRQERGFESRSDFKISDVVKDHRGLKKQEQEDYQKNVAEEVEKRITELRTEAYREGFEKGKEEGHKKAYDEAKEQFESQIGDFVAQVENVKDDIHLIYNQSKQSAYSMVKNLSKWVILKEVDEKYYLARLLEKLIHEINTKLNLVIHVNEESFGYMPEIVKIVERKVGKLTNMRVEVDLDMEDNGIKLESENTIIDGSLKAQFDSIDKLFKNVASND